ECHRHADQPEERGGDLLEIVLLEALLGLEDAEEERLQDDEGRRTRTRGSVTAGTPRSTVWRSQPRPSQQASASAVPSPRARRSEFDATADVRAPRRRMQ